MRYTTVSVAKISHAIEAKNKARADELKAKATELEDLSF